MRRSIKVLLKQVLNNNRKYLKDVFELTEDTYLEIMSAMGPSNAFRDKYKNGLKNNSIEQWETANPTRGWCAQMTRFLKDYQLIPEGILHIAMIVKIITTSLMKMMKSLI